MKRTFAVRKVLRKLMLPSCSSEREHTIRNRCNKNETNDMSVFIYSKRSAQAAQFIRSGIVFITFGFNSFRAIWLYFHMNPFNIIILLTGIGCLHISILDSFFCVALPPNGHKEIVVALRCCDTVR